MTKFYLVRGNKGEESDRIEWPVALYVTEAEARAVVETATAIARENSNTYDIWLRDVLGPWQRSKWDEPGYSVFIEYPNQPKRPEDIPNKYDPDHGDGEEYWIEEVEVRKYP
jgi:hypothetical protein